MKTPMILPWLAHRAGISDPRAEELWREACAQAAARTGERDGPAYWGAAIRILLDLLAQERWKTCPLLARPWLLAGDHLRRCSVLVRPWLKLTLLPCLLLGLCTPVPVGRSR